MKATMRCVYVDGPVIGSYDKTFTREGSDTPEKKKQEYYKLQVNELPETKDDKRINRVDVALWSWGNRALERDTIKFCAAHEKELRSGGHVMELDVALNTYKDRSGLMGVTLINAPRMVPATENDQPLIKAAIGAQEENDL